MDTPDSLTRQLEHLALADQKQRTDPFRRKVRRPRARKRKDVYEPVHRFEDIDRDRSAESLFDRADDES